MCHAVMIFAAGFGTRMKHLTRDRPKPMIPVAGRPLIDHALDLAEALPAESIVVNLHYKPETLVAHLADRPVHTILEHPEILDTGGGLRHALPLLGTAPVVTLNSDAVWRGANPLQQLKAAWDPEKMDALLMCIPPQNAIGTASTGDFAIDGAGRARRGAGLIYGGAQIIKTDRLAGIADKVFSLNVVWDMLIAENRLYAAEYDGFWADVGHPGGIEPAEDMLRAKDV